MAATNRWKSVWDRKGSGLSVSAKPTLEQLIREDGFDSGAGDHSLDSWQQLTRNTFQQLGLQAGERVLEVGCGSGAFLYPAWQLGAQVSGVDYSWQLVKGASRALPEGCFVQAEAAALPLPAAEFSLVLCHSVFQYFASEHYAVQAIREMQRVLVSRAGRMAILDINDSEKEDAFYQLRGEQIGHEEYREKYQDYPHRFYRKEWFARQFAAAGMRVEIEDQAIPGYGNSAFRFNVYAWGDS